METSAPFVPVEALLPAKSLTPVNPAQAAVLPRDCTFTESDWRALAPFWYPVAFSHEVTEKPHAVRLLDERVVVYRLANGTIMAARDISKWAFESIHESLAMEVKPFGIKVTILEPGPTLPSLAGRHLENSPRGWTFIQT